MDYLKLIVCGAVGGLIFFAGSLLVPHQGGPIGFGVAANVTTIGNPWTFTNSTTTFNGASVFATTTLTALVTTAPTAIATTTAGGNATTLSVTDLINGQYYTVNINQAANFTYTLPASSTITNLLPRTGNMGKWCFDNATSAAGTTLIFVAGTGIDLEMATSSTLNEFIGAGNSGCLTLQRKANTDFFGRFETFNDSD